MNTIGRTTERQNPAPSLGTKLVAMIRVPLRGLHQGQRSYVPRQKAGHMTASDTICSDQDFVLASGGPSTHDGDGVPLPQVLPRLPAGPSGSLRWLDDAFSIAVATAPAIRAPAGR